MPYDNAEYLPPSVQILLGTDRLLGSPENWLKSRLGDGEGRFCLYGALREAARKSEHMCDSAEYLHAFGALCNLLDEKGHLFLSSFNDAPETTFFDIKALLQEAIELESAKVNA